MTYKTLAWRLLKKLGNLTFSIFLLLIISSLSVLGTIIEQENSLNYYQKNYPISPNQVIPFNWEVIEYFNLSHLYTSWFFLSLLAVFGASLLVCTFSTQLPGLKNARRWKFSKDPTKINQLQYVELLKSKTSSPIIYCLNNINYHTFHQDNHIYGYKGLLGRVAPIFVHFSLILVLFGSLTSLFRGFLLQEMVPVGEVFHLQNTVKAGLLSKIPQNIIGRINSFQIEYYPNKSIKQFYSNISLLNHDNKILATQTIAVNKPLSFEGLTFYQTDWQVNGIRLKIGNSKIVQVPLQKITSNNQTFWIANFYSTSSDNFSLVLFDIDGKISYYDQSGRLFQEVTIGQDIIINHTSLRIKEIMTSTGLQIKQDPGTTIIYLSFLILMLSVTISYISYSQIWIVSTKNQIRLSGNTNRAKLTFEEDVLEIKNFFKTFS
jgi:cytochrome c biogenesis protein